VEFKIGQTYNYGLGRRDAFHFAVVLVHWVGEGKPTPGMDVVFADEDCTTVKAAKGKKDRHAVIDPYLEKIPVGKFFFVILRPDITKDLTHNFNLTLEPLEDRHQEDEDDDEFYEEDDGCRGCG